MRTYLKLFSLLTFVLLLTACSQKTSAPTAESGTVNPQADQREEGRKRGKNRERPQFADLLTRMDANKDGKLAITEMNGRLKENFTEIDTNNDGFITEEEFKNAPRPQRPRGGRN